MKLPSPGRGGILAAQFGGKDATAPIAPEPASTALLHKKEGR
ncbi:MAG: hypothetical protein WD490_09100 [Opitutales bacterium]